MAEPAPPFAASSWAALPAFAPYRPWLSRCSEGQWPAPTTWQALLSTKVAFVSQQRKLAVGIDADDVVGSYPDHCRQGTVPSRNENLHDFCNALVWARFPLAKAAHAQALVDVAHRRGPLQRPRLRSALQDRLAMIDEGGLIGGEGGEGGEGVVVFGHALLEDAVRGRVSRGYALDVADDDAAIAAFITAFAAG